MLVRVVLWFRCTFVVVHLQYSILDEALPRRDLYSCGVRVFWRCLDFLVRQVRLQRVFQQKAAREKEVNKVLNRKLEEALRLIEVLQATGSFEQDGKYLLFKSQMFDCDSIVMFNYVVSHWLLFWLDYPNCLLVFKNEHVI